MLEKQYLIPNINNNDNAALLVTAISCNIGQCRESIFFISFIVYYYLVLLSFINQRIFVGKLIL